MLDQEIMYHFRYKMTLRVWHPSLTAADIEKHLVQKAQVSQTAGDKRISPAGHPLDGTYKETYCSFGGHALDTESESIESAIHRILIDLESKPGFKTIMDSNGKVELFLGLFANRNIAITLPPALLLKAGQSGVHIALDIYP